MQQRQYSTHFTLADGNLSASVFRLSFRPLETLASTLLRRCSAITGKHKALRPQQRNRGQQTTYWLDKGYTVRPCLWTSIGYSVRSLLSLRGHSLKGCVNFAKSKPPLLAHFRGVSWRPQATPPPIPALGPTANILVGHCTFRNANRPITERATCGQLNVALVSKQLAI